MTSNALKIIAMVTMTIDHMGYLLFPACGWMRIIGRIAFPIFAYMIAEGCRYTHNRRRYLLQIAGLGIAMQIVLFIVSGSLYQSVFISFTLSIILIYAIDNAKKKQTPKWWIYVLIIFLMIIFLCMVLPEILYTTDYNIDYNIVGILIPPVCYFITDKRRRIIAFSVMLIVLSVFMGGNQWYCLLSVLLIATYNYKRGSLRMKNFFYIYYPVHMCVLYAISYIMG